MILLDTNIIIDHLRQPSSKTASKLLQLAGAQPKSTLCLSQISIQELYEGRSTKVASKEKDLLAVISPLKILPYSYEVSQLAGTIARDNKNPLEFADAAIAATAVINNCQLYTLNSKHFAHIPQLQLL